MTEYIYIVNDSESGDSGTWCYTNIEDLAQYMLDEPDLKIWRYEIVNKAEVELVNKPTVQLIKPLSIRPDR